MPEIAAAPELLEGAGAEGGGLGGMMKDFNDNPVTQIGGQEGGKLMHMITGSIGTGGGDKEKANIGPIGSIA
jgi:hypothetical protein